jgi:microcystin-dependent protein
MPQKITAKARALLAASITSTATSVTLEIGKGTLFPTANTGDSPVPATTDWFKLVLEKVTGEYEIVYVRTRIDGEDILSDILRGQEGTTAMDFPSGSVAGLRLTPDDIANAIQGGAAAAAVVSQVATISAALDADIGMVSYFARSTPPATHLVANGAVVSRATYAKLFAVIGTTYGAGNGSTTFKLPDLRGEFIRGWDGGRGIDTGRVFGALQRATSVLQKIVGWTYYDATNSLPQVGLGQSYAAADSEIGCATANTPTGAKNAAGDTYVSANQQDNVALGAHSGIADSTYLGKWITHRPRNVALLPCIKFDGAGLLDV